MALDVGSVTAPAAPPEEPAIPADAATEPAGAPTEEASAEVAATPADAAATQADVGAAPAGVAEPDPDETAFDREARQARERLDDPARAERAKAEGWTVPTDEAGTNTDRWS